jgi:hypothetical protein
MGVSEHKKGPASDLDDEQAQGLVPGARPAPTWLVALESTWVLRL